MTTKHDDGDPAYPVPSGPEPRVNAATQAGDRIMITVEEQGYAPVTCDAPVPCPFCGSQPKLKQVAHSVTSVKRKLVRVAIVASTRTLHGDTFWWECPKCNCTRGGHHATAQQASQAWNERGGGT